LGECLETRRRRHRQRAAAPAEQEPAPIDGAFSWSCRDLLPRCRREVLRQLDIRAHGSVRNAIAVAEFGRRVRPIELDATGFKLFAERLEVLDFEPDVIGDDPWCRPSARRPW
jgi:hypothetical protein